MVKTKTETNEEILKRKVRKVETEEDKALPRFSFSKLDCYMQCPFKYDLKYNQNIVPEQKAIYLDLGTLCHKIMEILGRKEIDGIPFTKEDKDVAIDILQNGIKEKTDKGEETIIGLEAIREKFTDALLLEPDNASGKSYFNKLDIFINDVITDRFINKTDKMWRTYATEKQFEFVYQYGEEINEAVRLYGFIDRVDINENGDYRIVDYKTGKAIFPETKTKTSLQHTIYNLATFAETGKLPIENLYDFIFLNELQPACSKGYIKRAIKKLDAAFAEVMTSIEFKPNATPLCYFCDYTEHNPNTPIEYQKCDYYLEWTPDNKVFTKHREWRERAAERAYSEDKKNSKLFDFEKVKSPKPKRAWCF